MVAVVLVGAGVVALGLSGGDGDGTSTAPADLDLADVEPALLTADDVGEGFAVDRDDGDDEDDELSPDDADVSDECREVLERFEAGESATPDDDEASASFERADDLTTVEHSLSLVQPGEPSLGEVADGVRQCDTISYEDDGTPVELRLQVDDDVADLGDETVGMSMEAELSMLGTGSITIDAYGIIVSRDGVVSTVYVTGPFDPATFRSEPADRDLTRELAERADEKLQEVLDG